MLKRLIHAGDQRLNLLQQRKKNNILEIASQCHWIWAQTKWTKWKLDSIYIIGPLPNRYLVVSIPLFFNTKDIYCVCIYKIYTCLYNYIFIYELYIAYLYTYLSWVVIKENSQSMWLYISIKIRSKQYYSCWGYLAILHRIQLGFKKE